MNILRISFKYSPDETAKVMAKIYSDDDKISKLVNQSLSSHGPMHENFSGISNIKLY